MSKHELIASAEKLLTSMLVEAAAGEAVVVNAMTNEERVIPAVPFNERMRLIGVATSFLEARNKLAPEDENEPSQFEKDTANARATPKRRTSRKKSADEETGNGGGAVSQPGEFTFDPLAQHPSDRYITHPTGSRSATALEQTGTAGSAD